MHKVCSSVFALCLCLCSFAVYPQHIAFVLLNEGTDATGQNTGGAPLFASVVSRAGGDPVRQLILVPEDRSYLPRRPSNAGSRNSSFVCQPKTLRRTKRRFRAQLSRFCARLTGFKRLCTTPISHKTTFCLLSLRTHQYLPSSKSAVSPRQVSRPPLSRFVEIVGWKQRPQNKASTLFKSTPLISPHWQKKASSILSLGETTKSDVRSASFVDGEYRRVSLCICLIFFAEPKTTQC